MNERIKLLVEKADAYALKTIGDKWVGWEEIAPGWVECRDSKFAELIVQRTLEIVDAHTEIFQSDQARAMVEHIKHSVKTDFGVES